MAKVKPFKGLRPPVDLVERIACRPYDVLSSEEARSEAGRNEKSLYHIIKPEINFPEGTSEYDPRVYLSAAQQFKKFQEYGWLVQDAVPCYYLYAQTMQGKTQYGIVLCACVADYISGVIKRHELTRRDKEEDRMKHVNITNANIEPVFFAYPDNEALATLIAQVAATKPTYHFTARDDGFAHSFWVIKEARMLSSITQAFDQIPALYIADGHHRSAAAALVGLQRRAAALHTAAEAAHDYFMAVCFQASELTVLDYNRVVKDLNGHTPAQILSLLEAHFEIIPQGVTPYRPSRLHDFSLYLDHTWYALRLREDVYLPTDSIAALDVSISSHLILDQILGITDLRTDKRIDFVGGLRGLDALQQRVDSGEMALALALYPVSMHDIMRIADEGKIMPPKATWFEPKLRSGLVIYKINE